MIRILLKSILPAAKSQSSLKLGIVIAVATAHAVTIIIKVTNKLHT